MAKGFLHGTVHEASADLQLAIRSDEETLALWQSLTPLGRNEFICWVEDAKQLKTRQRRIKRTLVELNEGKKRPCCWAGCIHRADKAPSRWQQAVLVDKKGARDRAGDVSSHDCTKGPDRRLPTTERQNITLPAT